MATLVELTRTLALKCSKLNSFAWAEALNQSAHVTRYAGMSHEAIAALWEQHLDAGTLTIDVSKPPMVFIP